MSLCDHHTGEPHTLRDIRAIDIVDTKCVDRGAGCARNQHSACLHRYNDKTRGDVEAWQSACNSDIELRMCQSGALYVG